MSEPLTLGTPLPPPPAGPEFLGTFRKLRLVPLDGWGMYRGSGSLQPTAVGLAIRGKHVLPQAARAAIALGLAFFAGIIGGYLLAEFVILRSGNVVVPWTAIRRFVVDPKGGQVAVEFDGPKWTSPIVFKSERWSEVAGELRAAAPGADAGVGRPKRTSKAVLVLAVILGTVVLFGLALLVASSPATQEANLTSAQVVQILERDLPDQIGQPISNVSCPEAGALGNEDRMDCVLTLEDGHEVGVIVTGHLNDGRIDVTVAPAG